MRFPHRLLERRQCGLDHFLRQVAGDEHHAGAPVLARPLRQQHRRVEEVLHAVQYDRLVGAVAEGDYCLEPQKVVAAHRRQAVEPTGQHSPGDWLLASDAKGADAVVVTVGIGMFVVVPVVMLVASGKGLVAQPALDIDTLGRRIEKAEVEQQCRIDRTLGHRNDRGARVECTKSALDSLSSGGISEIGFGQEQPVGHRRLLDRLGLPVERAGAVNRVDRGDDAVEHVACRDNRLCH
jgi:hypothetical protein